MSKKKPILFLDPGHGGKDSGARGIFSVEKTISLFISSQLYSILLKNKIPCFISRYSDIFLNLPFRCSLANLTQSHLLISIHCNASIHKTARGIETWYYSLAGKIYAEKVQKCLIVATGARDRGIKKRRFYVLKYSNMPAILVECGFITNPGEEKKLNTFEYQQKIVMAILKGLDYL